MIIYDLCCDNEHRFEGWFQSAEDYQQQQQGGLLSCPLCASAKVSRLPSACYVHTRSSDKPAAGPQTGAVPVSQDKAEPQAAELLQRLQDFLDKHSDDVGSQFAEEAKKIHYGESKERSIHGQASVNELVELHEEGISVLPLSVAPSDKKKLN